MSPRGDKNSVSFKVVPFGELLVSWASLIEYRTMQYDCKVACLQNKIFDQVKKLGFAGHKKVPVIASTLFRQSACFFFFVLVVSSHLCKRSTTSSGF